MNPLATPRELCYPTYEVDDQNYIFKMTLINQLIGLFMLPTLLDKLALQIEENDDFKPSSQADG